MHSYLVYVGVIAAYLGIVYIFYVETRGLSIEEIGGLFDERASSDRVPCTDKKGQCEHMEVKV